MRTLLVELRPSALTDISLPDLLRQLTEATIGRARLPVELRVDGETALSPDVQVALYRITQEALNNVVKYAKASQASVSLRMSPESVRVTVIDNGMGFEPENVAGNHFGLRIMRERAEAIGARVSVYSEPGQGTQISAVWNAKS
jgi:signal transduction histidine kinase